MELFAQRTFNNLKLDESGHVIMTPFKMYVYVVQDAEGVPGHSRIQTAYRKADDAVEDLLQAFHEWVPEEMLHFVPQNIRDRFPDLQRTHQGVAQLLCMALQQQGVLDLSSYEEAVMLEVK